MTCSDCSDVAAADEMAHHHQRLSGRVLEPVDPAAYPEDAVPLEAEYGNDPLGLMNQAADLVYGDRNEDYGHPADDYDRTAGLWSALLGVEITAEQAALMMALVKFSREMNRPKADNVIDAHGYLLCYGRIRRRRLGLE